MADEDKEKKAHYLEQFQKNVPITDKTNSYKKRW